MLKTLMAGTAIAVGISAIGTGAVLAQMLRKPALADMPRLLLIDDKDKHKNKHDKHVNKHRDEDEDRDENEDRGRRSSNRTSRSSSSSSQWSYGSSPYYGAPRGYGGYRYYDQPYYDYYGRPYYPYGR